MQYKIEKPANEDEEEEEDDDEDGFGASRRKEEEDDDDPVIRKLDFLFKNGRDTVLIHTANEEGVILLINIIDLGIFSQQIYHCTEVFNDNPPTAIVIMVILQTLMLRSIDIKFQVPYSRTLICSRTLKFYG